MAFVSELKLSFNLSGKKHCYFKDDSDLEYGIERKETEDSMFVAWMNLNKVNSVARQLTYVEIPGFFTWNKKEKMFKERKRGFQIGRIEGVPREMEEAFFLRILLHVVRGPTCVQNIRTFEDVVYETYKEACLARGIFEE